MTTPKELCPPLLAHPAREEPEQWPVKIVYEGIATGTNTGEHAIIPRSGPVHCPGAV